MAYNGYNEAKKKANEKYLSKLAEIKLRMSPGEKQEIERRARAEGKSVNQYIKDRALSD